MIKNRLIVGNPEKRRLICTKELNRWKEPKREKAGQTMRMETITVILLENTVWPNFNKLCSDFSDISW